MIFVLGEVDLHISLCQQRGIVGIMCYHLENPTKE